MGTVNDPTNPVALYGPANSERTGPGDITVTIPCRRAARWRLVVENSANSTGDISGITLRRSAIGTHYGPAVAASGSFPVAPGAAWGASDEGDCVDLLSVTIAVTDDATVSVSLCGMTP